MARWMAIAVCGVLVVSAAATGSADPAQAADGTGDGKNVMIAVAHDGFSTHGASAVHIQTSTKYPGTVRFVRASDGLCLATKGGTDKHKSTKVQWTGCNGHSSKNWVVEPMHASTNDVALHDADDDTVAAVNIAKASEQPRFIVRSYRYPSHCLYSSKAGLNGGASGTTPDCDATSTALGSMSGLHPASTMHFAIVNDNSAKDEWEFLRRKMHVGAIAMYERGAQGMFRGENLWVKPMSTDGEYVGLERKAAAGGFFAPGAVEIDPVKEGAVVSRTSSVDGCYEGSWWWGIDNTRGLTPLDQQVTSGQQKTDEFGWSAGLEVGHEAEGSILFLKGKFSVKVSGSINKSWSTARTNSQSINMSVPPGMWGMAVATTPSVSTLGNWMTGTELDRPWKFNGMSTVALKNNRGEPSGTLLAHIDSHERKSCRASAETSMPAGVTPTIDLPEGRLAPHVGDTLTAVAPFIDPQSGIPLDIKYQWYADDRPISGQTLSTLQVTSGMVGKKLQFRTYESGGSMRLESQTLESEQSAPVLTDDLAAAGETLELPEAIHGRSYEVSLANALGVSGRVEVNPASLPRGLTFDPDTGILAGVAAEPGIFTFPLSDEHGAAVGLTLHVDPAPTRFSMDFGATVETGTPLEIPLVDERGSDASYRVETFGADGSGVALPDGVRIGLDGSGAPLLTGTPASATVVVVRITEVSPHHAAGDARVTSHDFRLQVVPASSSGQGEPVAPSTAPGIVIERILESDEATEIRPGSRVSWQATATDADELSASVHRVGDPTALPWADAVRTLSSEIEIDAVPVEPGHYVLNVAAANSVGSSTEEVRFSVLDEPADGSGGSADSGAEDAPSGTGGVDSSPAASHANDSSTTTPELSHTGGGGGGILFGLGGVLAAAGILLLHRNRRAARAVDAE
ncbi:putative Ig domain-containing protein [Leucobacter sp. USCH14]|uniref:putative Ig domain-containing protein n=1 Tax=Leucobacter sp. USCH14 TaxID=3024838 RepID=UPI0030B49A5F